MKNSFKRLSEHDAVVETVKIYTEAAVAGDGDLMKKAFYKDAMMHGFVGPDFIEGPIQVLFDWTNQNSGGENLYVRIGKVEIIETIAIVRVEMENYTGYNFTDLLTLVKSGDVWKISSKAYHTHL